MLIYIQIHSLMRSDIKLVVTHSSQRVCELPWSELSIGISCAHRRKILETLSDKYDYAKLDKGTFIVSSYSKKKNLKFNFVTESGVAPAKGHTLWMNSYSSGTFMLLIS